MGTNILEEHILSSYSGHIDCADISTCQQMLALQYSVDLLKPKSIFLFGDTHQGTYDSKITLQHFGLPAIQMQL